MPVIKITRKTFGKAQYDISHTVTGILTLNKTTYVYIGSDVYQGPDYDYKLFDFNTLVIDPSLGTIANAIQIILPSAAEALGYEATAKVIGNSIYAQINVLPTQTVYDIAHTVTGSLNFNGLTDIFLSNDMYSGPGIYKIFKGFTSVSGWEYLNMVSHPYGRGFRSSNNEISIRLN